MVSDTGEHVLDDLILLGYAIDISGDGAITATNGTQRLTRQTGGAYSYVVLVPPAESAFQVDAQAFPGLTIIESPQPYPPEAPCARSWHAWPVSWAWA